MSEILKTEHYTAKKNIFFHVHVGELISYIKCSVQIPVFSCLFNTATNTLRNNVL